jgi:hypothetical protein
MFNPHGTFTHVHWLWAAPQSPPANIVTNIKMKACQTVLCFKEKLPIQTTESKWKYKDGGPLSKANVKNQRVSDSGNHKLNYKLSAMEWE